MKKIIIAILTLIFYGCSNSQTTYEDFKKYYESPALEDSVNTLYNQVIDSLIPFKGRGGDEVSFSMSQPVNYNFKEYSFIFTSYIDSQKDSIGITYNYPQCEVLISEADSKPILVQLMNLFQNDPKLTKLQATSKLKVRRWKFTTKEVRDIETLMQSISSVKFNIPEIGPFTLDAVGYHFIVRSGMSNFDIGLSDGGHPLVLWALKMKKTLEKFQ